MQHSLMCCGVQNKQYCFKNSIVTPAEYEKILADYATKPTTDVEKEFRAFCASQPKRAQIQVNCEDSTGDYLFNCHQAVECYDCFDVDHGKYLLESNDCTDSMDLSMHDKEIELCYEVCAGGEKNYLTKFSFCPVAAPECEYTYACFHLKNSFGCDGFHSSNKFCILNKPYDESEYTSVRAKLIQHMKQTGEYGEFFPSTLSPFAYNESAAQDYLPLTKEQAVQQGFTWHDEEKKSFSATSAYRCVECDKPFRVLDQELGLYKKITVAKPTRCVDCRQRQLRSWKNPRQLYQRICARCQKPITTTYAPNRPEQVYCEDCYRKIVY